MAKHGMEGESSGEDCAACAPPLECQCGFFAAQSNDSVGSMPLPGKIQIALGSDHAGFRLKEKVREYLARRGAEVRDLGTESPEAVDYPDYAERVARQVANGQVDCGILVCGTGVGMMLAANKVPGIRAIPCNDTISAYFARAHNDGNILTLGSRLLDEATMEKIVDTWLATPFEGGRHERRIKKIDAIDEHFHAEKSS